MKVKIGENLNRTDSGKHKFLSRLSKELRNQNINITDSKTADIFLHIGRNLDQGTKCKIKIARVDGLILNYKDNYKKQNKKLVNEINQSDGIVYQGNFCRKSYEKFLGINKVSACILNGANPKEFLPRNKQNFFLANCKWRPHKRLDCICDSFIQALDQGLDSDLIVIGKVDKKINHHRIKYKGWVGPDVLKDLLSQAIATLHLAWLDWCPNAMVESAIANCPIVYTDSGGSSEVGEGTGVAIKDRQWDFKLVDLYSPPSLNQQEIVDAMIYMKNNEYIVNNPKLSIEYVAQQYLEFFERLLNKK